jgi:hypothetical protein
MSYLIHQTHINYFRGTELPASPVTSAASTISIKVLSDRFAGPAFHTLESLKAIAALVIFVAKALMWSRNLTDRKGSNIYERRAFYATYEYQRTYTVTAIKESQVS